MSLMTAAGEYQAVPHLSLIRAEEVRTGMSYRSQPRLSLLVLLEVRVHQHKPPITDGHGIVSRQHCIFL